jgi:CheY-like chemotaxis protein
MKDKNIHSILIIEDNPQNMYMMRYLLEKYGFTVIGTGTGEQGIAAAKNNQPDVIILDIQLPFMDGYQVAQALKSTSETSGIPVIAVTSYAMPGDRQKAIEAGADGYIEKPIDPETFVETMLASISDRNKEPIDESTDS